ncbi:MAG: ribulose-phosphate 3-epimerase [Ruminococcus sp.]
MQISASILSADVANLAAVTAGLERSGLDMLHFDVMDGQFVPNITFGMPVLAAIDQCTNLFMDVHLMIKDPLRYAEQFVKAGADLVTFHLESDSDPVKTIEAIHEAGAKAGIVLKPGTSWEEAIPYLGMVEVVLVMTVEPGFGGQSFLWDMVKKVEALREYARAHQLNYQIEVDGGINAETAPHVLRAGAEILVIGSYLFRQADPRAAMDGIRAEAAKLHDETYA